MSNDEGNIIVSDVISFTTYWFHGTKISYIISAGLVEQGKKIRGLIRTLHEKIGIYYLKRHKKWKDGSNSFFLCCTWWKDRLIFYSLPREIEGMPLQNIGNYDLTNLQDDLGAKHPDCHFPFWCVEKFLVILNCYVTYKEQGYTTFG